MVIHHRCLRDCRLQQMDCHRPERYRPLRWRAARSSRCFAKSLSLNDDAKKLQMSAMKACFQIAECSFFLCKETANERNESLLSNYRVQLFLMQRYDIFPSQLYANGHRPKKKCKKMMDYL